VSDAHAAGIERTQGHTPGPVVLLVYPRRDAANQPAMQDGHQVNAVAPLFAETLGKAGVILPPHLLQ
jgi:hypothetical protein